MRKIVLTVLSGILIGAVLAPNFASAAQLSKNAKRHATRSPTVEETEPPEMIRFRERQIFKRLGNENPKLVQMLQKCQGELFCLAALIKARDERRVERIQEEVVNQLIMDMIAVGLPTLKEYLNRLRDEASKSGDEVYAGKFAVAVEQAIKTSDIFVDLRAYNTKKRQASENEDKEELTFPSATDKSKN